MNTTATELERLVGAPLSVRRVAITSLHLDPANARSHPERNLDAIKGSLARFGQAEPLVVQKSSSRVIGGNGRLVAMKALGWSECDVVELDIDDVTATALGIALNRSGELAEWNLPALTKLLETLRTDDQLAGVGFDSKEIDELLDQLLAETQSLDGIEQDQVPSLTDAAVTRTGDLWILGRHRLLCGDSAKREDLDRLLAGERIHLAHVDAPYNVRVEPRSNNAIAAGLSSFTSTHHQGLDLARRPGAAVPTHERLRAKDRPLANDFVSDEEFARLLRAWYGNMAHALEPGRAFFAWGGYGNIANYPSALAECGLHFAQTIIWNKLHPVLTRKDFMGAHEWCFYGWKQGAPHVFLGPNNVTDLWEVKKVNPQSMVHLTEKPVELAARAIQYSSRPGENVLDLFGGSGSTLVAAEQTQRNAFLMELDPLYCDVIVRRFEALTKTQAVLEATRQTFAAITQERGVQ